MLASDAFFPFSWGDSVEIACQAGVKAIVRRGAPHHRGAPLQALIDDWSKYQAAWQLAEGLSGE